MLLAPRLRSFPAHPIRTEVLRVLRAFAVQTFFKTPRFAQDAKVARKKICGIGSRLRQAAIPQMFAAFKAMVYFVDCKSNQQKHKTLRVLRVFAVQSFSLFNLCLIGKL
jgi:hypothetical protein